jgi:SnoaL-like domain
MLVHADDLNRYVVDRLAIQQLVFSYNHAIDEREEALFASLWAPDAGWHFPVETARLGLGHLDGIDAIMGAFRDGARSGRKTHHVTANLVVAIDGDRATGRSKAITSGRGRPSLAGYEDVYFRAEGGWKFQLRCVTPHLHGATLG